MLYNRRRADGGMGNNAAKEPTNAELEKNANHRRRADARAVDERRSSRVETRQGSYPELGDGRVVSEVGK